MIITSDNLHCITSPHLRFIPISFLFRRVIGSMYRPSPRWLSIALLLELPFLMTLFGLLAWFFSVFNTSINLELTGGYNNFYSDFGRWRTTTVVQSVTEYPSSSYQPASTFTITSTVSYTYSAPTTGASATTYTRTETITASAHYIGLGSPTGTLVRTIQTYPYITEDYAERTGRTIQPDVPPPSVLASVESAGKQESITATRARRQATPPSPTPAPSVSSPAGVTLNGTALAPGGSFLPTANWQPYASVTVNAGLNGNFQDKGLGIEINSNSGPYDDSGIGKRTLARIRALIALAALAMVAVILRLISTALHFILFVRKAGTQHQHKSRSPESTLRSLTWANLTAALVLVLTLIPFWAFYGWWTRRTSAVQQASKELNAARYEFAHAAVSRELDTQPFTGTPISFVVFWVLCTFTSWSIVVMSFHYLRHKTCQRLESRAA